jgi:hypothetical protein
LVQFADLFGCIGPALIHDYGPPTVGHFGHGIIFIGIQAVTSPPRRRVTLTSGGKPPGTEEGGTFDRAGEESQFIMVPWTLSVHAKARWSRTCRMGTHIQLTQARPAAAQS